MIVTLDGQRLPDAFAPDLTLRGLIDGVRAQIPTGIIVSVRVNGLDLDDRTLERALEAAVGDGVQIDLESASGPAVAAEALREAAAQMHELRAAAELIGELLVAARTPAAVQKISEFVLVWQTCRRVVSQSNDVAGCNLTAQVFEGRSVSDHLAELVGMLRELRDALEARDMVLLADHFQYEMPELCAQWSRLLRMLADALRPAEAAGCRHAAAN